MAQFAQISKGQRNCRSGLYDFEFSESSAQSKITLDGQADKWGFLPLSINHPKINLRFDDFLKVLIPGCRKNQTVPEQCSLSVRGMDLPRGIQKRFFTHSFVPCRWIKPTIKGVVLSKEAELDLHGEQFAWDAEVISLDVEDLNLSDPVIAELTFRIKLKSAIHCRFLTIIAMLSSSFLLDQKIRMVRSAIFRSLQRCSNRRDSAKSNDEENFGFVSNMEDKTLSLLLCVIPTAKPSFSSESDVKSISGTLDEVLVAYHDENKLDAV